MTRLAVPSMSIQEVRTRKSPRDESAEAILLISGLGAQMIRWTVPFCESLVAKGFRVIRFDNRDVGGSTHFTHEPALDFSALANAMASGGKPAVPYTLYEMVEDAIGLLDALGIVGIHHVQYGEPEFSSGKTRSNGHVDKTRTSSFRG